MRLYLDHDVDIALARRPRQSGHNVLTTRDAGNADWSDDRQLAFATIEDRVFLTHNRRDFRRLHRQWVKSRRSHTGIIISAHLPLEEPERRLPRLIFVHTHNKIRGQKR